jgi:CRP-like cAMP-binding protein
VLADLERQLRAVFGSLATSPETEWDYFRKHFREGRFAAGESVVQEGTVAGQVHYIALGLVRIYHNKDGAELVHGFDYEGRFCAVYESVLTGQPSEFGIQALEPTHTIWFPGETFLHLYDRHPCWERVGRKMLEEQYVRRQDKEKRFRRLKPDEHYKLLLARNSPLVTRVPLNQLASYLQIAPETLSRIRSRIRSADRDLPDVRSATRGRD